MSKHLFILSSGPNDAIRAAGCLRFAKCAAEEGHEVVIMLSDDAVYMATSWRKPGFGRQEGGVTEAVLEKAACPVAAVPTGSA